MSTQNVTPESIPTALPKPPTQSEIMNLLRERMPGLALYNPAEEWLRMQVHGIEHYLPPDLGGAVEPHPVSGIPTKCDGVYLIRGRWLTQRDSSGKVIEGQDAQSIVAYVIHRERFGEMGVVWLPGRNPEEDEALKQMGRDKWLEYRELQDDRIIAKRREFKANWEKNPARAGVPCPPPTPLENAAMERMQERETKKAYPFECNVDDCPGYATESWEKYAKHMAAAHSVTARRGPKGITLTNQAGDSVTVADSLGGTDGKPVEVDPEELEALRAKLEEKEARLQAAEEKIASVKAAEPKKPQRGKRG